MIGARFRAIFTHELGFGLRRPLFWVLIVLLALLAYGLAAGNVAISSGSSDTGGPKAWMTSEFANARSFSLIAFLFFTFFVAVGAGLSIVRDEEARVSAVLHATGLTAREYVWGKFLGVALAFVVALCAFAVFSAFSAHALTGDEQAEFVGPFLLGAYLRPLVEFGLPQLLFVAGTSFALGTSTRRPILVFLLPTGLFLFCIFFLFDWAPSWLDPRIDRWLQWIEPSGFRWLNRTWLEVDRGVGFYNTSPVPLDAPFVASRLAFVALGLGAVAWTARRFEAVLRGRAADRSKAAAAVEVAHEASAEPLAALAMRATPPSFAAGALEIAKVELRELRSQPGLYLFVPLILLQTVSVGLFRTGAFDTPLLATSGLLAAGSMNTLTLLVCLLLLFYTVESLERERASGLDAIHGATSARTSSILFGKSVANACVGVVVMLAAFVANAILLLVQGKAPIELGPFVLLWGVLLTPTFLLWASFVTALYALFRGRFGAYGAGLAVLAFQGYAQMRGWVDWSVNWNLWNVVRWSDLSVLELDRTMLVLNRVAALAAALFFTLLAVRFFPRRHLDPIEWAKRIQPRSLLRGALRTAPGWVPAVGLALVLNERVDDGFQGDAAEKRGKDYWRKNLETYKDYPVPSVRAVDLDLELDPARRWFSAKGWYVLENDRAVALDRILVTPGHHFTRFEVTLDGEKAELENRAGLYVLKPKSPLAIGGRTTLGFSHEGHYPDGATKNGGGLSTFVLEGGVVLTSFGPEFVPMLGFAEGVGVDEDNRTDAKDYPDDFHVGQTDSVFGMNMPFTTDIRVTVPAGWRANSIGVLAREEALDGKHLFHWKSDHPVTFFNVVAGRWAVKQGEGTAIYYHPEHHYNIDEMSRALDAARRRYSEWFAPFPWNELKLSEFPGLSDYAQGFPTNITFSESIGFLTESDPEANVAFMVTAHEAAHQWWGNLLSPGKGPGGNVLSEGAAHFSTILLHESELGLEQRIAFCKQIETQYNEGRSPDSERALVRCDGTRAGDGTVTYDKGGWVFWMLLNHMGRERCLAGIQSFLRAWEFGPDHAVLQDFVEHLRPFASDTGAYDAFVQQWFFDVVVPEYELSEATKEAVDGGWIVRATLKNKGSATMPVELAASRGERFPKPEAKASSASTSTSSVQAAEAERPYEESRTLVVLGKGESSPIEIRCAFEPETLVVDPDALVLQIGRKQALKRL